VTCSRPYHCCCPCGLRNWNRGGLRNWNRGCSIAFEARTFSVNSVPVLLSHLSATEAGTTAGCVPCLQGLAGPPTLHSLSRQPVHHSSDQSDVLWGSLDGRLTQGAATAAGGGHSSGVLSLCAALPKPARVLSTARSASCTVAGSAASPEQEQQLFQAPTCS